MEQELTEKPVAELPQEAPVTVPSNLVNGRPCKEMLLPITQQKVFMAEYMTAGEDEDSSAALMKDVIVKKDSEIPFANTTSYTHKQVQSGVKKIVDATGQEVPFSLDWYRNLPKPDLRIIKQFILDNYKDEVDEEGKKKK